MKIIDLFAGLGGIRIGFEQAMEKLNLDCECVFSSEIKPYAISAYQKYFGDKEIFGDITKINDINAVIPDFDFLLAGFPCQPFSSAGTRKGFIDTRGTLFFEIEKILKAKIDKGCPASGFLLENVEGLVNHDHGRTLAVILDHLNQLGYAVTYAVLDSQFFGLPQTRKRIYIVGTQKKISLENFPVSSSCIADIMEHGKATIDSVFTKKLLNHYRAEELYGKSIKDKRGGKNNIHSWDIGLKGDISDKEKNFLNRLLKERRKKHWADVIGIQWMDGMPLTEKMISSFYDDPNLHEMLQNLTEKGYLTFEHPKQQVKTPTGALVRVPDESLEKGYNIVAGKLSFEFSKILDPNGIAPTLTAMDVSKLGLIDGNGIRKLTVRECQRLFGYPENYDLSFLNLKDAYDLLGNTVCIPVIEKIAERMIQKGE